MAKFILVLFTCLMLPALAGASWASEIAFMSGKVILIDPGHGGFDPGTVRKGIYEKQINLEVAKKLKQTLEETGAKVTLTRTGDYNLAVVGLHGKEAHRYDLKKRLDLVDKNKAVLLVSLHVNAFGMSNCRGSEVFYYPDKPGSKELAEYIMDELRQIPGTPPKRSVKSNDYFILRNSGVPAVLVETGYLSNPADRDNLVNQDYQKKLAEKISFGIVKYLAVNAACL
ncbi:N-acetylmuramoyl-L-alanine amidase [Desulfocucumis palustris]|uniref:N-acetylmuramoyl-L-alanine amidase n=1 Tax=Desulfocucumis palustris TaxID=1898651 RepID=A0A2L2XH18_9FIRM|nr:N-acetylmuramoyl-L-alanine amidase [Desulfocucumis palustris]GBF35003.1 N-acetylmuramoyl-L-alanine amidase [Desulfocucumis palustris]